MKIIKTWKEKTFQNVFEKLEKLSKINIKKNSNFVCLVNLLNS